MNKIEIERIARTEDNCTVVMHPFPLSLCAQKRLLELIYDRKSGIITRQELINVLFSEEDKKTSLVMETVV
mgnify:CR=1 FL=1